MPPPARGHGSGDSAVSPDSWSMSTPWGTLPIDEVLRLLATMNGGSAAGDAAAIRAAITAAQNVATRLRSGFGLDDLRGLSADASVHAAGRLAGEIGAAASTAAEAAGDLGKAAGIVGATTARSPELAALQHELRTHPETAPEIRNRVQSMMVTTYSGPMVGIRGYPTLPDAAMYHAADGSVGGGTGSGGAGSDGAMPGADPVPGLGSGSGTGGNPSGAHRAQAGAVTDLDGPDRGPTGGSPAAAGPDNGPSEVTTGGPSGPPTVPPADTPAAGASGRVGGPDGLSRGGRGERVGPGADGVAGGPGVAGRGHPSDGPDSDAGDARTGTGTSSVGDAGGLADGGAPSSDSWSPAAPGGAVPLTTGGPAALSPYPGSAAGPTGGMGATPASSGGGSGAGPSPTRAAPVGGPAGGAGGRPGGGDQRHRTASYLHSQQHGDEIVGDLPLVGPPVIGDWAPTTADDVTGAHRTGPVPIPADDHRSHRPTTGDPIRRDVGDRHGQPGGTGDPDTDQRGTGDRGTNDGRDRQRR